MAQLIQAIVVKGEMQNQTADLAALNAEKRHTRLLLVSHRYETGSVHEFPQSAPLLLIEKACYFSEGTRSFSKDNLQHLPQQPESQMLFMG